MFTGLIEELGRIEAIEPVGGGKRLAIAAALVPAGLAPGDSVAVNGVCLTVVACNSAGFTAEAVTETL
ncbi:MAG TPA: riboflavin synthase, partial [bacterium]|nr:riboflavin synthase [bacterium]